MSFRKSRFVLLALVGFTLPSGAQESGSGPSEAEVCSVLTKIAADSNAAKMSFPGNKLESALFEIDCGQKRFTQTWELTQAGSELGADGLGRQSADFTRLMCETWHWQMLFDRHWTAQLDITYRQQKLIPTFVLSVCPT